MKTPEQIIKNAINDYSPVFAVIMFSGGHDSLVCAHYCSKILEEVGIGWCVYHGDTTIGIPETQDYVKSVCKKYGWRLEIRKPPKEKDHYDNIVQKYGFPGPTKASHQLMYRRLKERALQHFVSHEVKSTPYARENVMLLSGIRRSESEIRMGYTDEIGKSGSKLWVNPIFWWDEDDCENYMEGNGLPRNEVKDKICISGECLCGSFGGHEEFAEIKECYPDTAKRIERLHEKAKENGYPWPWSKGPTEWYKHHPPGAVDMFTGEVNDMPMCTDCVNKKNGGTSLYNYSKDKSDG